MIRPNKFLTSIILLLISMFILSASALSAASTIEKMPVSEIKAGMKGIALTVVDGTVPEEFTIEVVAILKNAGYMSDLILFKASGPLIEKIGGIISGMSGSPVYIGGKLVGAISHLLYQGSPNYGMITPIDDMLKIFDYMDSAEKLKVVESTAELTNKEVFIAPNRGEAEKVASADTMVAVPVNTPIMVNGLNSRALDLLNQGFAKYNVSAVSGGASSEVEDINIVPGSSIAVQISKGDIELGAFGTVTYVENDRFLAFGHSFLSQGAVGYLASASSVAGVLKTSTYSKIATSGQTIGVVMQDRLNGVGGTLGAANIETIPITISAEAKDTGRNRTIKFEMIQEETLVSTVVGSAMLSLLDSVIDRMGGGTASVLFELKLSNGTTFNRDNIFYDSSDIASVASQEILSVIEMIAQNTRESVKIEKIDVKVFVSPERKTARILSATPKVDVVKPGDCVEIDVEILPYRQASINKTVIVNIPENLPEGTLGLIVGMPNYSALYDDYDLTSLLDELLAEEILVLLEEVSMTYQNNYLLVNMDSFYPSGEYYPDVELYNEFYDILGIAEETDWVIEGYKVIYLEISPEKPSGRSGADTVGGLIGKMFSK